MVHAIEVVRPSSNTSETLSRELFHWFMMEYLPDRSIDLTLVHMPLKDEGVYGWMMRESDYEFIIQIEETLEGNEYTRTFLHECYHVMQHVLNISRCETCAYLSEKINLDKLNKLQ
jgi:hypothetical protein